MRRAGIDDAVDTRTSGHLLFRQYIPPSSRHASNSASEDDYMEIPSP